MTTCKTAWIIDDDELCKLLTANTLELNKFCSAIRSFTNGQEALAELKASVELGTFPDLIFLDINMPVLDGWGFLEAFSQYPEELKKSCSLYILSSSIDEEDFKRAKTNKDVRDFFSKPLKNLDFKLIKLQAEDR